MPGNCGKTGICFMQSNCAGALMDAELFDAHFNLRGEPLTSELDAEGEARVRALAESEARKAQTLLWALDEQIKRTGTHEGFGFA